MTTIIADLRPKKPIMMADNQMSGPGGILPCTKLFRIKDGPNVGHIIGVIGYASPCTLFIEWYSRKITRDWADMSTVGIDIDINDEDFECIILQPKGIFIVDRFFVPLRLKCRYHAGGSGGAYALGAMDRGAPAEAALDIACHRDPHTGKVGRKFQLMTLGPDWT